MNPQCQGSPFPDHILEKVCTAALRLARHVVVFGQGEGERAHGFTLIVGRACELLEVDEDLDGLIGESNLGTKQMFENYSPKVTDERIEKDRLVIAAFKEDGAIVIDGRSGEFKSMNYMVANIGKGDKSGGARHKSASAVAQLGGGCFVIKASEEVTKRGYGDLDIFRCTKEASKESVKDDVMTRLSKAIEAGRLLIDAGEYGLAVEVLNKVLVCPGMPMDKPQKANVLRVMGSAFFSIATLKPKASTYIDNLKKAQKASHESTQLWDEIPEGERDEASYARALVLEALALSFSCEDEVSEETAQYAEDIAVKAINILQKLGHTSVGFAWRALGRVNQAKYRLKPGYDLHKLVVECFQQAIVQFEKSGTHEEEFRCALAYWNVYHFLETDCRHEEALPWLKHATWLSAKIRGPDHDFSKKYRHELAELLEKCSANEEAAAIRGGSEVNITDEITTKLRTSIEAQRHSVEKQYGRVLRGLKRT